ncbi:hypothetical protein SP15_163 [Bacillus phage SP-15]|uniref:Uncharacterized protein n=1 Tax=Bacillus phage SP-15 TaxID=1792032 RepID=A0A127AYX7_9CAUD|nr:hypothetical protein SP15_163 [Bacillus phage SP-15]AMM44961.1 hypothetical protein SP15_163 [Bacillus phage SP-15]
MIIGIHKQPRLPESEAGFKIVAGDTLEDVYKSIIQQLRLEDGQDGDMTTITFSNGTQVIVRREVSWDNPEDLEDDDAPDEFSEFDEELGSEHDFVDVFVETPEIRFREISSTNLSVEELIPIFTRTIYRYEE